MDLLPDEPPPPPDLRRRRLPRLPPLPPPPPPVTSLPLPPDLPGNGGPGSSRRGGAVSALTSLLVYDGGSRDGLLWFLTLVAARPVLRSPDLDDDHLLAAAGNFPLLTDLRLQSRCLVTGSGLRSVEGRPLSELVLINCDAVEREPGLLTTLVQSLKQLKTLDLSYNDKMRDKDLRSMLASCGNLVEMRVKGCKELTGSAMAVVCRFCKLLQSVDVVKCRGVGVEDVELVVLSLPQRGQIAMEEGKLSDEARSRMWRRSVQLG